MTVSRYFKVLIILGVIAQSLAISEKFTESHDFKHKFRYVEPNKEGSNQAWLESRNGNLALRRHYVDLPNGNAQKDASPTSTFSATTFTPLFGTKLSKFNVNSVTSKSTGPKLNYTPVPGGFYLTHESIDPSNGTTEPPNYVAGLTSQTFSTYKDFGEKYSEGVVQSKANKQSFHPTSENVKNEIKQLHIQSTTPSIKTFEFSGSGFSTNPVETRQFSQLGQRVKIPSLAVNPDRFSYSEEKSIEKTSFAPFDAKIISEVQKHAEQIILKDLQKSRNVQFQNDLSGFSPRAQQPTTVTMRPIVVSEGGEVFLSTTPRPEILKSSKTLQSDSINAVKITEKITSDPNLEDSGYFRVSLSPGLTSSITVAPATQQLIDAKSANRNSASNNSTLCESNLCEAGSVKKFFPHTLPEVTTEKELDQLDPLVSGTKTNKITHSFYPKNKIAAETHYVTTIDVQKGISLDVHQNEDGSIQLAENFPFNKLRPYQTQSEFNQPTPPPLVSNPISVTPGIFSADPNLFPTSQKSYILNTVTTAPGLFDVTTNKNVALLQGFNDVSSHPVLVQDRIGGNRQGLEDQLVSPVPPTGGSIQSSPQVTEDLNQVEKNIQELRQQILDSIDAQHEEEQRKQNLVDEERRQYFENLRKVEALKDQNSVTFKIDKKTHPHGIQSVVVSTPAPVEEKTSEDDSPKIQYVQAFQPADYETEYKGINSQQIVSSFGPTPPQFPLVYSTVQTTPSPEIYSSQAVTFSPQTFQEHIGGRKLALFNTQNVQNVNMYPESSPQHKVHVYNENDSQQTVSTYSGNSVQQVVPAYSLQQVSPAFTGNIQQTISSFDDNSIQQTSAGYTTQKAEGNDYVHQVTPISSFSRYADTQIAVSDDKATQFHSIPISIQPQVSLSGNKLPEVGKPVLFNTAVPFDYSRLLRTSLSQEFPIPMQTKTPVAVPAIYAIPQPIAVSIPMPATYKLLAYADVSPVLNKQYQTILMQKPNKLRVQPLKPSTPSEDSQKEAIQNLLSQPQFHRTYLYAGLPYSSRLQLRQIGPNQISNSEQVRPQILTRRGKSLKNLRIEYGFKPPLRPSVEFSEEVKPSIYGPSVPPQ